MLANDRDKFSDQELRIVQRFMVNLIETDRAIGPENFFETVEDVHDYINEVRRPQARRRS